MTSTVSVLSVTTVFDVVQLVRNVAARGGHDHGKDLTESFYSQWVSGQCVPYLRCVQYVRCPITCTIDERSCGEATPKRIVGFDGLPPKRFEFCLM